MRKETKPSNWDFVKRRARQFMLFLIIGVVKNGRLSTEAIFSCFEAEVKVNLASLIIIIFRSKVIKQRDLSRVII